MLRCRFLLRPLALFVVGVALLSAATAGGTPQATPDMVFPDDAGWCNVKTAVGAKGDGTTDDTAALNEALKDGPHGRNTYLPAGTYVVSDTLLCGANKWKQRMVQGQSRDKTIIKLKDNSPGFGDASRPKPVLEFFPGGSTGQSFNQCAFDVCIDVGKGNPGAVGVHWLTNNYGTLQNLKLIGDGHTGISMTTNWPGPGLITNIIIKGFDYGIYSTVNQYGITLEHLYFEGQKKAGISNKGQKLFIRDYNDKGTGAPAMQLKGGLVTLIDANLSGSGATAIDCDGPMFARNITTSGFTNAIDQKGSNERTVVGPKIDEFVSHELKPAHSNAYKSLNLPIEDTPDVSMDPPAQWAKAGAGSAGLQAAIDSGKTTVYIPAGGFTIDAPVILRGNVRRIFCNSARIKFKTGNKPAFIFNDVGGADTVVFERFVQEYGSDSKFAFEHTSAKRTLVIRHGLGSIHMNGAGKLFVEDVCTGVNVFDQGHIWARQLNPECQEPNIVNNGADFWMLGLKIEKGNVSLINNGAKARSEILGAYILQNRGAKAEQNWINKGGSLSVSWANGGGLHSVQVEDTQKGQTTKIGPKDCPNGGWAVPLYVSTP